MRSTVAEIECPHEKAIRLDIARKNYAGNWQAVSQGYEQLRIHRQTCIFCQGKAAEQFFGMKVVVKI